MTALQLWALLVGGCESPGDIATLLAIAKRAGWMCAAGDLQDKPDNETCTTCGGPTVAFEVPNY